LTGVVSFVLTFIWICEPQSLHERKKEEFSPKTVKRLLSNRTYSMACLATFTVFFTRTGINSMMIPFYADGAIGLNKTSIGTVLSYATLTNLALTVPFSYAIDYFGRKPMIVRSLAVTALSAIIFPMTSDYYQISLATVLLGIGTSGAGQAPPALATDGTIEEPHGLSMGLYRLFGDIGFVVGPILLGIMADGYGLRMPFYFMAGMILINAVLLTAFAKETYSVKRRKE